MRIGRIIAAIGILGLLFAFTGCLASKEPGKYSSRLEKFSIQLPVGWHSIDPRPGVMVSVENPGKTVIINVSADKVATGYTDQQALQHFNSRAADNSIFYSGKGDALLSGMPGHWLKGISSNQKYTSLLYFIVRSGHLYSIEFFAAAEQFDNYQVQFDSIIQSFKFD